MRKQAANRRHPIARYMRRHAISYRVCARELGFSAGYLCDLVKGRRTPSFTAARTIARAIDVPIETLFPEVA